MGTDISRRMVSRVQRDGVKAILSRTVSCFIQCFCLQTLLTTLTPPSIQAPDLAHRVVSKGFLLFQAIE
jgi:hypothetical protein